MRIGQKSNLDLELNDPEGGFENKLGTASPPEVGFGRLGAAVDVDDLLLEASSRSVSDTVDWSAGLWRSFRTVGPLVAADVGALVLAGSFAWTIVFAVFRSETQPAGWAAPMALLPLLIAYALGGLYSETWVHPVIELRQLSHITTLSLLAAAAGGMWAPHFSLWCAVSCPLAATLVPVARAFTRKYCAHRHWWGFPTLLIGSGAAADTLAKALFADPKSGLRPVLLTDPHGGRRSATLPVVNDPATLHSILRASAIQHAVISLPELSAPRSTEILNRYSGLVPHLLVLSNCSTLPTLWAASRGGGRMSGIEVHNGLLRSTLQAVKRGIDLTVATTVLCVALPIMAGVAVLIKLTSKGPVLFGHTRIGRRGRSFKVWKFRTMKVNGAEILREHLAHSTEAREEWERDHKLRDDPRVTRLGRFLRRSSLDELPQIWNVLKGDMTLVGPRPIVRDEIWRYGNTFRLYAAVKPGITGLWQVSGRNDVDYGDRVRLDEFYVRHWSPWLDVYILARTTVVLFERSGAY